MISDEKKVEIFKRRRARLFGIAYRRLGTHAESEDILQEAYLKRHQAESERIETPEAWLVTVVTRLSIDRLRKASKTRETYIGQWLPEPLAISGAPSPEEELELASNLSLAFMVLLERSSPVERAAFLLHDIFDCGYSDIARIIGKTEAASRQLIHRARERVRTGKPRKVAAARRIVTRKRQVAHALAMFGKKIGASFKNTLYEINGEPRLLTLYEGKIFSATTFEFSDGKISAVYRVMNPDKLKAFAELKAENFAL